MSIADVFASALAIILNKPFGLAGLDALGRMTAPVRGRVSILDFGGDPTGVEPNDEALDAAIASVSENASTYYVGGPRVYFPAGRYRFDSTIELKKTVILEGDSSGEAGGYATQLVFPSGVTGILISRYDTEGAGKAAPTTGGDASIIRNIQIIGAHSTESIGHGIHMRARAIVEHVRISYFSGNGINIVATSGSSIDENHGNANCWSVSCCRITNNQGHGMFVNGADSNAGYGLRINAVANGGCGIYDSSFLGNKYDACHTSGNGDAPYKADNPNARNVFDGCYSETGHGKSYILTPALITGGQHGGGFVEHQNAAPFIEGAAGNLRVSRGIESKQTVGDVTTTARLGGNPSGGDALVFINESQGITASRLRMVAGDFRWDHANLSSTITYRITGPQTTLAFGRSAPVPHAFVGEKFFLGNGPNARNLTYLASAPTAGNWGRGDRVYNLYPVAGGFEGWVCVAAGTPGTWKEFGSISI